MSSLSKLREINVSFNELELVPESLCLATTLVKIYASNNFADLQSLPRSIGNLELLEELDISNNQKKVLPDSFRLLTQLRVFHAQENPLEVPPRHIAEQGAQVIICCIFLLKVQISFFQAVVSYMSDLIAKRDVPVRPARQKHTGASLYFFKELTIVLIMVTELLKCDLGVQTDNLLHWDSYVDNSINIVRSRNKTLYLRLRRISQIRV